MQLPISDEMEMLHTHEHRIFAVIKFPFDAVRLVFSHPVVLYVTHRVLRYQWQSSGIVSYLDPQDRYSFAVSNLLPGTNMKSGLLMSWISLLLQELLIRPSRLIRFLQFRAYPQPFVTAADHVMFPRCEKKKRVRSLAFQSVKPSVICAQLFFVGKKFEIEGREREREK